MKNRKNITVVVIAIICVLFIAALTAVILTQVIFTIKTSPTKVKCLNSDATYTIEYTAERYLSGTMSDYEHAWAFDGELPSKDPADYIDIYLMFDVENTCYVDQYTVDATLKSAAKYSENILFVTDAGAVVTPHVWRRQTTQAYVLLEVYIGNLNEDQIRELVSGITLSVKAQGDYFGTRNRTVSFKECDNISIER